MVIVISLDESFRIDFFLNPETIENSPEKAKNYSREPVEKNKHFLVIWKISKWFVVTKKEKTMYKRKASQILRRELYMLQSIVEL